jgi:enoyl-CoA hydratase/carnithine racemase
MALIDVTKQDRVALFTLNAPPANTYSYEMMRELDAAILDARMDDAVQAIVLTGAGDKFFCAGADIAMLDTATPTFKYQFCLHANETLNRLEQTNKLVVAALNGHCVGGGLEVALAADLRVARRSPDGKNGKVGLPEVKLGVLPGTGGTARLSRLVGKGAALELMLEGKNLDIDEAKALGIVNKIFDAATGAEFVEKVVAFARSFCAPKTAAMAVGHIKRSVQSGLEMSFEGHLALERELQQRLFTSMDAKEGIKAYVEKREPRFEGR